MIQFIRSASLTGFAELCRRLGLDPVRMADAAGVPARALTDPDMKLSTESVARLLDQAAALSGAQDFGLRLAETRRLSNLGPVGLIAREQPTLRKALEVMSQYQWLHNEALSLTLDEMDDIAVARINFSAFGQRVSRQAVELSVAVLCGNLKALLGPHWRPEAVMFRHGAPTDVTTHFRLFGRTPEFLHDFDGLVLRRADLDVPLEAADPEMARQVERYVEQLALHGRRSWHMLAGDLIVLLLPTGTCSADRVAEHLGCDRRTLHRKLIREGTSFRALMDEKRSELVLSLMSDERPFAAIADLGGFASASSFSHWFQKKFGQAPRDYRAQALAAAE